MSILARPSKRDLQGDPVENDAAQKSAHATDDKKVLTAEEKRARARQNWGKLRTHIKQMRFTVNFLVQSLDEANEAKTEHSPNYGQNARDQLVAKDAHEEKEGIKNKCLNKIVIHPQQSSWLNTWRFTMNLLLFYGYFNDPYHIAFHLTDGLKRT